MPTNPPCSILKTLTITFTPPTIAPANGYTVRWRVVGTIPWNTISGLYSIPITIPAVPACFNLEGEIQANCAGGGTSNISTFAVAGNTSTCYLHTLSSATTYSYVGCGSTTVSTITVTAPPETVCAIQGSVSGGPFTQVSLC